MEGLSLGPLLVWALPLLYLIKQAASEVGWMVGVKDAGLVLSDDLSLKPNSTSANSGSWSSYLHWLKLFPPTLYISCEVY